MALRDFERVRERIEIRLEVRHIAQLAVGTLLLLSLAFGSGWWLASSRTPPPTEPPPEVTRVQLPDLPAPRIGMADRRQPILPRALAAKDNRKPKLARVIEAIARNQPLPSATAAQHRDEPVHSEEDETPFEHVANNRVAPAHPVIAPPADKAVLAGAIIDASPESPSLHPAQGWAEIPLRPAHLVQSQYMRPAAEVSSLDPERQQHLEPASLYLTSNVGPNGAAWATALDSGGETVNVIMVTPLATTDVLALRQWQLAERRAVLERIAKEEGDKLRLAAQKAADERREAERLERERHAAEQARLHKLAAEQAERERLALEKAAKIAEQKRLAAEKAEEKRSAAEQKRAAAEQRRLADQRVKAKQAAAKKVEQERLAAMKVEHQQLVRQKAASQAEEARQAKATKAAAAKLAKATAGTKANTASEQKAANEPAFFLQVKAFRNVTEARIFVKLLTSRGHKPRISRTTVPKKGVFHRVRIGPFKTAETARTAQRQFEAREPYETMVMSR